MSNPLADLTQAPLLYQRGGKTYEVSPLTQTEWGQFLRFAQFLDYYIVKRLPDVSDALVKETFNKCLAKTISLDSPEIERVSMTPEGVVEMAYLSLVRKQPTLTREDVAEWLLPELAPLNQLIMTVSLATGEEAKKKTLALIANLKERNLLA